MSNAPDRVHLCTKGAVASNFQQGIIFGAPEASKEVGTVEYVRADLVEKMRDTKEQSDG